MTDEEPTPITKAIETAKTKEQEAADLKELEELGEEARRTFPTGWKLRLFDVPGIGVAVSIEFVVTTQETAAKALRAAIDGYKTQAAADPQNAARVLVPGGLVGPDGKPFS